MTPQPADSTRIIRTLNTCIEACLDAQKGYRAAAADARDPSLKALFDQYAGERAEFVFALEGMVEGYGGTPVEHGSAKGAAHRGFMEARVATEAATDVVVLGECERGELGALARYDHALARTPLDSLPGDVRSLVVEQRAAIRAAYDAITGQDLSRRRIHH